MSRTAQNFDRSTDADRPALDDPEATARERTAFIERAVADAGADGVVVTLTGDVDSTVVAGLAVEALGPESVRGLVPTTDAESDGGDGHTLARRVATELGVATRPLDVAPYVDALTRTVVDHADLLGPPESRPSSRFGDRAQSPDAEVRAAAFRSAVAVSLGKLAASVEATASSRLVLGPGTRTSLVGAAPVRAREPGVDLLPLGDLYRTEVRQLARHLDVPTDCADVPPADPRWFERTATADGPLTAETADAILWKLLDDGAGIEQTADALDVAPALVGRVAVRYARRARRRTTDERRPTDDRWPTDPRPAGGATRTTESRSPRPRDWGGD
ncbi:hypothetical protein [Halorussus sp. AFM4]|uniref:hypothetical protein n=1 Tax=Halorussus sp. AFM4 TaxID=3421651 RepID=UPI003EBA2BB1